MAAVTHQTVKLSRGKHESPERGTCVMELASMLAGEPFSDHPKSVCPVIAEFLRRYNDSVDDRRRQALYGEASRVVGSRGSLQLQRARANYLASLLAELQMRRHRWMRWVPTRLRAHRAPGTIVAASRAAGMLAARRSEVDPTVSEVIDALLGLDENYGITRGDGPGSAGSESERMLSLRQLIEA